MAKAILVIGASGTGKSTAWRNMPASKCCVISPNSKPFPFKGAEQKFKVGTNLIICNELSDIPKLLKQAADAGYKYILVEDFTHFMTARITSTGFLNKNTGNEAFSKWNYFGADAGKAIQSVASLTQDDVYVVFNHHTETKDDGSVGMRTAGKLLDNVIDMPSYFTYIFHTIVTHKDGEAPLYQLMTNTDGKKLAKSPMGCFSKTLIDNDVKLIIDTITEYNNVPETVTK